MASAIVFYFLSLLPFFFFKFSWESVSLRLQRGRQVSGESDAERNAWFGEGTQLPSRSLQVALAGSDLICT